MKLLGIDPGKKTGLALMEGEPQGKAWAVHWTKTCDQPGLLRYLLDLQEELDGVAVEWWEYQGQARAQGCAFQANYSGYAAGLAEGVGATVVTMTRTAILKSLGLKRNSPKRSVRDTVKVLTVGARPNNEHEADAMAVVIASAGRFDEATRDHSKNAREGPKDGQERRAGYRHGAKQA